MLPENLKSCCNLTEFKNSIKSWIPRNYPSRLCKHYVKINNVGFMQLFDWGLTKHTFNNAVYLMCKYFENSCFIYFVLSKVLRSAFLRTS